MLEMFCLKCKMKVQVQEKDTRTETTPKGRKLLRGSCPNCGTKMAKFIK